MNKFECLEDRCLIRPIKREIPKTNGAIIDPGIRKKPTAEGEIVSIGDGRYANETGALMPTILHQGDVVLYPTNQDTWVTVETENGMEELLLMREGDVIMRISEKINT